VVPLEEISIKCKHFKCFGDKPQGFDEIKPINIIIGRNNSGKSTLLDSIQHVVNFTDISGKGHGEEKPHILISWELPTTRLFRFVRPLTFSNTLFVNWFPCSDNFSILVNAFRCSIPRSVIAELLQCSCFKFFNFLKWETTV